MFLGRALLDSDHFTLTAGLFGKLEVASKYSSRTIMAVPDERRFFLAVCAELKKRGVAIALGDKYFADACDQFCEAICARPNAGWRTYFQTAPIEVAGHSAPGG